MFRTHVLVFTAEFEAPATTRLTSQNDPYNDAHNAILGILASIVWHSWV